MANTITSTHGYAGDGDVGNVFGPFNAAVWSQLDPEAPQGTPDLVRFQTALNVADARIVDYFSSYGNYNTPLQPQADGVYIVTDWCAKLAGVWLYENRGTRDTAEDHKYAMMKTKVLEDMAMHVSTRKLNAARRWPTPTCPVGV